MGIVPLVFKPGENLKTHGLTGFEKFDILGSPGLKFAGVTVKATADEASGRVQSDHRIGRRRSRLTGMAEFWSTYSAIAAELARFRVPSLGWSSPRDPGARLQIIASRETAKRWRVWQIVAGASLRFHPSSPRR
jgi:hypothetical protein